MRDIRAKNIVSVDTISKGNTKPWQKLIEFMETVPKDEEVNFTFESIKVYQPWAADTFTKLLSDPRVHMTFMNDAESVKTIELMLHLNGYKTGRIVNKDTRTNKKEDKAAAIIKYREEVGAFKSIDELTNVSGIGEKTLEKLRDSLEL